MTLEEKHKFFNDIWQFYKRHASTDPIDFEKVVEDGEKMLVDYPDKLRSEMIRIVCEMIQEIDMERRGA